LKQSIFTIFFCFLLVSGYTQTPKIYNPEADVSSDISQALIRAKAENKHLFLQVGGNWCSWCLKFHKLCTEDAEINAIMTKGFIPILVNYSKENRNYAMLKKLDYPQRFGFPVFVILDSNGKRIHTQNSGYLEDGDGYSKKKVLDFLSQWSPESLNPENYKEK
jgi:thioredoxin-related protein